MYLVKRNPALLHANNKGTDLPVHRQSYQHLFFLESVYGKNQKYRLSFKRLGSVGPDLSLHFLLMLSADQKNDRVKGPLS